jgi:dimethylhistidine N-methyltransferase
MTRHERKIRGELAAPIDQAFAQAVLEGLAAAHKHLPCQYFYDARGSQLFEEITRLEEYYPTRVETAILLEHARSMAAPAGRDAVLVEFGSGSSRKTELLLRALDRPRAYVPIDVSQSALNGAKRRLARRLPALEVIPALGDFCNGVALPQGILPHSRLGFFPGSTIGNFDPAAAVSLLRHFAGILGPGARCIVGVDLEKNVQRLLAAYNDAKGVTAAFNLNLLARINRELGGDFDLARFRHVAVYDQQHKRIEMHLVSSTRQQAKVLGRSFTFEAGETIHTENSYKYSVARFQAIARQAGWEPSRVWTDGSADFSVHELQAAPPSGARQT